MRCSETDETEVRNFIVGVKRVLNQKTLTPCQDSSVQAANSSRYSHKLSDLSSQKDIAQVDKLSCRRSSCGVPLGPPPLLACLEYERVSRQTNFRADTIVPCEDSRKRKERLAQVISNDNNDLIHSGIKRCSPNFIANKRFKSLREDKLISSDQKLFLEAAAALSNTTVRESPVSMHFQTPTAALAPPPYTLPSRRIITKVLN